jgi:hypothetical protein
MTDKVQKIREEVVRLKSLIGNNSFLSDYWKGCNDGREDVCDELISIIDSLQEEPLSEDLEEAAFDYAEACKYEGGEKLLSVEHFRAGANWQKQQMMKDATDACVTDIRTYKEETEVDFTVMYEKGIIPYEIEQAVKLIIIKDD